MRITSLSISNFLGIAEASIAVAAPVLFIAGPNAAGKSSIAEAIRQAFTGEAVRVDLKKEYPGLLHDNAKSGAVSIEWDGGSAALVLPSGDRKGEGQLSPALPFLLDAQRFANLDSKERRAFLFGLMGVKINGATVKERLTVRGCDADLSAAVLPYLAAGFESAQKEAQGKAREAKASWRTITGEAYGSQKAEGWKAEIPASVGNAAELETRVSALDEKIEAANQALGQLNAEQSAAAGRRNEVADLREKAGKIARIKAKLEIDTQEEASLREKVVATKKAASGIKGAATACKCPECDAELIFAGGQLVPHGDMQGDENAAVELAKFEKALALMESSVNNGRRDLASSEAAAERLKGYEAEGNARDFDGEIERAKESLAQMKDERRGIHADLLKARESQRQAAEADTKTAQAAELHKAVGAWEKIADALAPDGIPGDFLKEAIGPFNNLLAADADAAQWEAPAIDGDMNILVGGRPYRFRSESEKWRADALIASAIAQLSGAKFFLLDRFDVLDAKGRSDALYWLDTIAEEKVIDSAIVLGTLKALPGGLPATIQGEWVEGGRVAAKNRRAAA